MKRLQRRPVSSRTAQGAVFLLCVTVGFPAWAYGGAEPWAIHLFAALALLALSIGWLGQRATPRALLIRGRWRWLPIAALCGFVALQALNASHDYVLLDQGLTPRGHLSWLPRSVAAPLTWQALLLLLAYLAVLATVRVAVPPRGITILVGTVIAAAGVMALLALGQGAPRERWELVGRFLNENSYAAYANLVLPVALGAARAVQRRGRGLRRGSDPGLLLYFVAALLAASVLLCGSRAGAVVTLCILLSWLLLEWQAARRRHERSSGWLRFVLPVLPVAGLLVLLGTEILVQEAATLDGRLGTHVAVRLGAVQGTWQLFLSRPVAGVGAGAFQAAFPYYQPPHLPGFYRHAHNDWIQWLAELGVVGSALAAAALAAVRPPRSLQSAPVLSSWLVRGMWLALAGVALHACIDFPFRIPGVAVLAAAWLGIVTRRDPARATEEARP